METTTNDSEDPGYSIEIDARLKLELAFLFNSETVRLASQIDIVDLNLNEKMIDCITAGVRRLKELKADPDAQRNFVNRLEPGTQLLLCMWIMDMELLDKIQDHSYTQLP